jgi:hypothetical protein
VGGKRIFVGQKRILWTRTSPIAILLVEMEQSTKTALINSQQGVTSLPFLERAMFIRN